MVIAENLEAKPSTRKLPPACNKHPEARLTTLHECSDCQEIVELQPLCAKISCIAPDDTSVDVPVSTHVTNARIAQNGAHAQSGLLESPETAAKRAAALVAVDTGREIDQYKRLETKRPIDFEAIREARERAANSEPPDWLREWDQRPSAFEVEEISDANRSGGGDPADRDCGDGRAAGAAQDGDLGGPLGPTTGGADRVHDAPVGGVSAKSSGERLDPEPARLVGPADADLAGDAGDAGAGAHGSERAPQLMPLPRCVGSGCREVTVNGYVCAGHLGATSEGES